MLTPSTDTLTPVLGCHSQSLMESPSVRTSKRGLGTYQLIAVLSPSSSHSPESTQVPGTIFMVCSSPGSSPGMEKSADQLPAPSTISQRLAQLSGTQPQAWIRPSGVAMPDTISVSTSTLVMLKGVTI